MVEDSTLTGYGFKATSRNRLPEFATNSAPQSGAISTLTACSGCRGHGQLRRSLPGTDFKARRSWTVCAEMPTPGATSTFISSGKPNSAVSSPATESTLWRIAFCPCLWIRPVLNPERRAPGSCDLDPKLLVRAQRLGETPSGNRSPREKPEACCLVYNMRVI